MHGPGWAEIIIIIPILLLSMAVPIATLVGVFMIFGRVKRIEEKLTQKNYTENNCRTA